MCLAGILLVRAAIADDRPDRDQRRLIVNGFGVRDGETDRLYIVAVFYVDGMPAVSAETSGDILGKGHVGAAVERDAVAVVEVD